MATESERVFQRGEAVPIWVDVFDWDGNRVSPPGHVYINITNPDGVVKVDWAIQQMTEVSTGLYVYYYLSADDDIKGWWKTKAKATSGSYKCIDPYGFQLQGA